MTVTLARFRTLVQVASSWAGGWTTIEGAWATRQSDGFCSDIGSADIVYNFGNVQRRLTNVVSSDDALSIDGKYVRICEIMEGGSETAADGTTFQPVWVGIASDSTIIPTQNGYEQRCKVQGILFALDMVTPPAHFAVSKGGIVAADCGFEAVFNVIGDRKTGNRSAARYDFNGVSSYVFDQSGDGEEWVAQDIVEYAFALAAWYAPGGPTFTLDGQLSAIQFKDKFQVNGLNCMEIINRTLNRKQGVGFRIGYDGSAVTFDVMSLAPSGITVPDGNDVPVSTRQFTLDLTPTGRSTKWGIRQSRKAVYDDIHVVMGKNRYAVTLSLDHVEPDWTAEERTAFDSKDEDDDTRDELTLAKVGRRFKLKSTWTGACVGGFTMPNARETTTSELHGSNGWDGDLTNDGDLIEPAAFRFLKSLPVPEGYDWTAAPVAPDKTRASMKPMVFIKAFGSSTFETLAEYLGIEDIDFKIDEDAAAFSIGPAKVAEDVLDLIDDGAQMYFTVGIESAMHTVVSWRRADFDVVRDMRQHMTKSREKLLRKFIAIGTYLGCEGGTIKSNAAEVVVEDNIGLARTLLATLRAWYGEPEWHFSRTLQGGVALPEDYITGDMVTEAVYQFVDGSVKTVTGYGVITNIERDYENGTVSLSTERIAVDVDTIS